MNQCWNIVNWTLKNTLQWNFNRNSNIFIQENAFESVVCERAAILSRPQCVDICNSNSVKCNSETAWMGREKRYRVCVWINWNSNTSGLSCIRADSRFAPSQWETALLCNDVSHWVGASLAPYIIWGREILRISLPGRRTSFSGMSRIRKKYSCAPGR